MPLWHPISISGYHIREAGATAAQELAFTLKDGLTYVERALARGLNVDDFAPRLSFFFNAQIDLFEEVAKYRAARRIWARELRETFGAQKPASWMMRFHTQTAGASLTAQQPLNNLARTTIEALAGVLGGTQSLHTNSYDEALALPSEEAVRLALRTQQVIAHESGVASTVDPLGGSYFVEALTDRMEERCLRVLPRDRRARGHGGGDRVRLSPARDRGGGVRAAARDRLGRTRGRGRERVHRTGGRAAADPAHRPCARGKAGGTRRRPARAPRLSCGRSALSAPCANAAADAEHNLMEPLLECARANATEGEIVSRCSGSSARTPSRPSSRAPLGAGPVRHPGGSARTRDMSLSCWLSFACAQLHHRRDASPARLLLIAGRRALPSLSFASTIPFVTALSRATRDLFVTAGTDLRP